MTTTTTKNGTKAEEVEPVTPPAELPSVHQAFAAVMADVSAVGKDGQFRSQTANYNFRGIDGVMNAVGPALRKHGVVIVPTVLEATYREVEVGAKRTLSRECTVKVRYTVIGPRGDSFAGEVYGEALDSSDKGTAKATSVAYRIFLLQSLTIPTHEPDPDEFRPERSAAPEPAPVDPRISRENAEALIAKCEAQGLAVGEVVKLGTEGRTVDPYDVHKTEVPAVKEAMDILTPAEGEKAPE